MSDKEHTVSFSNPVRIDKETFETAYNLYWEKVYAVCYNQIREVEPAKGMVQDIFRSLWERRETLKLDKIDHYLIRSAKFKAFEYLRNKVSRQKHIGLKLQTDCFSSNCTEERILYNSLQEKVNGLVDTLPCQCKRVYKMSREDGLANKEIASILLISERAVEYHITKATSMLKLKLSHYSI
ncbi:MAG: sigma-70 family RNA polymerase sigma factor [Pedobacter sp.]|uniref:sigma-70 family RNA polymerase sigma factor n=1 Tax=Pedobacter sp. TaxID=1411316 RepID=UPI00339938F0